MRQKLIFVLLVSLVVPAIAAAEGAAPRLCLFPPGHLSAVEDTEILAIISGAGSGSGEILATVSSPDGRVRVDVFRAPVFLGPGPFLARVRVPASDMAPFRLGEGLTLTARLLGPGGLSLEDAIPVPLLAEAAVSPDAAWTVVLVDKPALVYTTRATLLKYAFFNPKNNPKKANLILKFKSDKGNVKAKWKIEVDLPSGFSEKTIAVPSSVTSEARLGNAATLLDTKLKRQGTAVAKDQALLDFDLNTTAAADPASGPTPLRVFFTASTTGGKLPYVYNWTFGDGSAASEQNPVHLYNQEGQYTAVLAVTDGLGGRITDEALVTVLP